MKHNQWLMSCLNNTIDVPLFYEVNDLPLYPNLINELYKYSKTLIKRFTQYFPVSIISPLALGKRAFNPVH